ncbi:MAG: hydrolase [Planctomycetes bacterium GWF2_41_51]|nr:MAG: hydrolase [Planctomycetes bacterium GWF2_41_51]HBG27176.1 hydrolase [Phycisphaerales bacterium]
MTQEIKIKVNDKITIIGNLDMAEKSKGLVIFAHGSGSSRFSTRNRYSAALLKDVHLSTLLIDLLTTDEEAIDLLTREYRFDIELLAQRVIAATNWVLSNDSTKAMPIGYFGASTGAAAALVAAAELPNFIKAFVSRGGRPDLAGNKLQKVKAPVLLIVGGEDQEVIEINKLAAEHISAEKEIYIVPGAAHLFEEADTLRIASSKAAEWYLQHLNK